MSGSEAIVPASKFTQAINKIDAAVALCMAVGAAMAGDTSGSIDDWLKSLA